MEKKNIHFIAIGGSVMHNLALHAKEQGHHVTGSDDEIFEPSYTNLKKAGILPQNLGWKEDSIHQNLDIVIVGMHTKSDNPELKKAQDLGLKIYSYPQYIKQQCQDKQRVVIGGSHGKSTVTAMVMHVLKYHKRDFDYLIGAEVEGFERNIRLTHKAPLVVIEGDEYASAPFDKTPKFLVYEPHIAVITGVAWDHINIYPTFEEYVEAFDEFADSVPKAGTLIYNQDDAIASVIGGKERADTFVIPYQAHQYKLNEGITYLQTPQGERIGLQIFGEHNLKNIAAAKAVCSRIGIHEDAFYTAIRSFKGVKKRLQELYSSENFTLFKDYAHAPSKVLATTQAVRNQFIDRKLIACLELHTYSSLNKDFLSQYKNTLTAADKALVYFNQKALTLKNMPALDKEYIKQIFAHENLIVFDEINELKEHLLSLNLSNKNLLMMSSGTFDNLDFENLIEKIKEKLS